LSLVSLLWPDCAESKALLRDGCQEGLCILSRECVMRCRRQIASDIVRCKALSAAKYLTCSKHQEQCQIRALARCSKRCKQEPRCIKRCSSQLHKSCMRIFNQCRRRVSWQYRGSCRKRAGKNYTKCLEPCYGKTICCQKGKRMVCEETCTIDLKGRN
jgi:hypothetical protein